MASTSEPIAIVGTSCRFAGDVTSTSKLWDLLCNPSDLSREVPPGRFNARGFHHPEATHHGTTNSTRGYWLNLNPASFDAGFFGINPTEAAALDPQQRHLLEVVYEAMEDAGFSLAQYGGKAVGVFSGCMTNDYETLSAKDELSTSQYYAIGNSRSMMASRVAFCFDFQGPAVTVDTACSSSLVALSEAVASLRAGECPMACVTGANLMFTPDQFIVESALGLLSPTGKCHMWDTRADGYARGEGFAAILLKPLSHAIADGDKIEGVIREVGVNGDGRTAQITEPNPEAQAALIRSTYQKAGLDLTNPAHRCQYFEAHGTGTVVGDPREAAAIHNAFFGQSGRDQDETEAPPLSAGKMFVGSIKTVIGHTEAAAGLAGVLKAAWTLKHGCIPPNLHFENLQATVAPFYTHLQIPTVLTPLPDPPDGQPRRASVNSFGFGGTNAHAIVERYTPEFHGGAASAARSGTEVLAAQPHPNGVTVTDADRKAGPIPFRLPLVFSAASSKSLRAVVQSYRNYLAQNQLGLLQLSWHQYSRLSDLPCRTATTATTAPEALAALDSLLAANESSIPAQNPKIRSAKSPLRILGIFTGQGAQWPTMSMCLLQQNRVYRDTIRSLDAVLKYLPQKCDWSLEEQITAGEGESRIREAAVSQPLCTAVQIALVDFLRSVGIAFHTVVGHSSGEIAAAYAAGKLSAQDAIAISYYRGMAAHLAGGSNGQKGGMLAANMSETEALSFCSDPLFIGRIGIAASNSPTSVTLSGDIDAIVLAAKRLTDQQKSPKLLPLDTAYHSWHMKKPAVEYTDRMREYGVSPMPDGNGSIWISSVKGHPRAGAQGLDCQYWVDNMVNQVQFCEAVEYALSQSDVKFDCAIEIGPRPALRGPFTRTAAALDLDRVIPYTCPLSDKKASGLSVPEFLGFMWSWFGTSGVNLRSYIEQSPMPNLVRSRLFNLPSYPFDHSVDYWRESRISRQYRSRAEAPHELLGVRCREDNEHEMKWRNILKHSQIPWLKGHQFQGQTLLPASAYCVMALGAARCVIADRHASLVQLENVEILSGIAINNDNDDPGVETVFRLEILPSDRNSSTIQATFDLCSCPANTDANSSNTMKKHANGSMRIVLGEPSMGVLPPPEPSLSETLGASPEAFYQMMTASGLGYTGPFKALKSIQRRYQHCHATLSRVHADDTTTLRPSPATLDACFQSTFLAYSAPSDGALWTSFLPARIGAVRFNLAALEGKAMTDRADTLIVDTHMVYCKSPEEARKASIAFDITISNEAKEAEIQIEELVIHAVANTSPNDDKELYLHTVMDVDPTDEIVGPLDDALDTDESPLAEKCRRIASFYLDNHILPDMHKLNIHLSYDATKSGFSATNEGVRSETQESIDAMIRNSKHAEYLESIASIGKQDPSRLSQRLPLIVREAHGVSIFRNHVGRIMRQIAHRYPWMNILHLATAQTEFTHPILAAIGDSFQSLTISMSQEMTTRSFEGVRKLNIDPHEKLAGQLGSDTLLDLVILPTTLLVRNDAKRVLKNISEVLKAGGFLVLIDPRTAALDAQLKTFRTHHPTLQYWQELLKYCGFVRQARNSDQCLSAGSVLVRQFREATTPSSIPSHIRCNGNGAGIGTPLLVCGTSGKGDTQLVTLLQDQLSFHYGDTMYRSLDDATTHELENSTAVIMLADLHEPLMSNMTEHRICQLRTLLRPTQAVLWVTRDARAGNPDHAASFGFLRTIAAEVPSLKLQVIDLGPSDAEADAKVISSAFSRLMSAGKDASSSLWTLEPECHVEDGRRLIPRVVPWKPGNDRVNASRRVVTRPVNVRLQRVEVVPEGVSAESFRFKLQESSGQPICEPPHGNVLIQVEYSSALPLRLGEKIFAYVCVGHKWKTTERMVALTGSNSSYVTCPSSQAASLPGDAPLSAVLLRRLVRYIAALASETLVNYNERVLLVDPDVEFARSVGIVVQASSRRSQVAIVEPCDNQNVRSKFADIASAQDIYTLLRRHPRTLERHLRQDLPQIGSILNFLPEGHDLSRSIEASIPRGCTIHPGLAMFSSEASMRKEDYSVIQPTWERAIELSLQEAPEDPEPNYTVTLDELQSQLWSMPFFQIVNWKAGDASLRISHVINEQFLFPDKMYFLFGMTRDFGHSLCRFFLDNGARNIVLASRNPQTSPHWVSELNQRYGASIRIERADVTSIESLTALKRKAAETMPPVGGVVNGAMVLEDRMFAKMNLETWNRVLHPKTLGSSNLSTVFSERDLDFFIMTSSFAAIGGHPGQSNYAAANMFMNGLAANRRRRGLAGSALNIGVIYGLGFLHREKDHLYAGLEREGYPPISERDLHHMFLEAIVAGRPDAVGAPVDITTGLRRYRRDAPDPLHWQLDPRFGHFARCDRGIAVAAEKRKSFQEELTSLDSKEAVADAISAALIRRLQTLLGLPDGAIGRDSSLTDLGIDSITANAVRNWFIDLVGNQFALIQILDAPSIKKLCLDSAKQYMEKGVEV